MVDVVEVFWDAGPALRQLGLRLDSSRAEPQMQTLLSEVKALAASVFPGAVTLVRTEVRAQPGTDLRIVRNGSEEVSSAHQALRTLIGYAIERLARDSAALAPSSGNVEDPQHGCQVPRTAS
jgi:hypothetical protein